MKSSLLSIPAPAWDPVDARRRRHREMLFFAAVLVLGGLSLDVRSDQRVIVRGLSSMPFPPSCLSKELLGIPCPGCGLTRSVVYLAHGQWRESLAMHRLGWLMALGALLQFPYRILALRREDAEFLSPRTRNVIAKSFVTLLMLNWIVGFFF